MKRKGIIVVLVLAVLLLSTTAFAASQFEDLEGHWAEQQVRDWIDEELAKGYPDGTFRPDDSVTRAEFVTWINRAFETPAAVTGAGFTDVPETAWFYDDVSAAVEAGIVNGYPDGTFRPHASITRQEAALVLARQLDLPAAPGIEFLDAEEVADWAREAVDAVSDAELMTGYPDGTFGPQRSITRAETVIILDRGLDYELVVVPEPKELLLDEPGTYGPEVGLQTVESVVIASGDVTLRNTVITGDLIIAEDVGEGSVTLENLTVEGDTYIRGGGKDSIYIIEGQYEDIIVEKEDGVIRIVAVDAEGLSIVIAEEASGITIILEGIFENVTVKGEGVTLEIRGEDSLVKNLTIEESATSTTVTGDGSITTATIKADDVVIEQTPEEINVAEGVTATVGEETIRGPRKVAPRPAPEPTPDLEVDEYAADNLLIEEIDNNKWEVSEGDSDAPIGDVSVTFNQDIDKEDKESFDIRAYDADGEELELLDEDFVRDLLYSNFSGGDDDQLEGTAENTYYTIYHAVDGAVNGDVYILEIDIYNSGRNRMLTAEAILIAP